MPIYEYACKKCGHRFDVLQKMSDPVLTDCPECGAAQLRKLVSAPSFRLKGSGWYETDFKSDKQRNLAGEKEAKKFADGDGKSTDGKTAEPAKGTESKPAKAADSKPAKGKDSGGGKSAATGSDS